jgi:hypothetical protein
MRTCDRRTAAGLALLAFAASFWQPWTLLAQAPEPARARYAQISQADLKEWLTYLASDTLQGRQVFTEGYGLASAYVADHLRMWGVKPLGDDGTYFESVKLRGYRVTRNSSVTISGNGQSKTFKHGDHVSFAANSGGQQTLTFDSVEFVGYGQPADLKDRDLKSKLIAWVPGPTVGAPGRGGIAVLAISNSGAKAAVGFAPAPAPTAAQQALTQAQEALQKATEAVQQAQTQMGGRGAGTGRGGGFGRGRAVLPAADLISVQRPDGIVTPQFTGDETLFDALFAGSGAKFADIRANAAKGEPLTAVSLPAKVTITIDNTFEVISQQLTRNVVGMVEGSDPRLKSTYVLFGAHLDHVGYSQVGGGAQPTPAACRNRSESSRAMVTKAGKSLQNQGRRGAGEGAPAAAPPKPLEERDLVNNGADDDGSGSVAMMAIAKAFATGPRPKRSVVFVWHTGEEAGLYGSRYAADFPVVPIGSIQAQLNMDMVGRDDCDNLEGDYSNSVFVVGADRISTSLHNLIVRTNETMARPLTLDYELNDPTDPESVYTRSDHYSYAAKGIPIAFFTTGLHQDYHRVTDTVDKIVFPKMARIAQLVYESGFSIANTERTLERDNKGPRTGLGTKAEVIK